MVSIGGE